MSVTRRAEVTWNGDLIGGSGVVTSVTSEVIKDLPVSWASRTGSPGGRTSPEELLAAAHASCYAMALSHGLGEGGTPPEQLDVTATVSFAQVEGGWRVESSALTVRGRVPGCDAAAFNKAAEDAKDGCPISATLKGNVALSVEASLTA